MVVLKTSDHPCPGLAPRQVPSLKIKRGVCKYPDGRDLTTPGCIRHSPHATGPLLKTGGECANILTGAT